MPFTPAHPAIVLPFLRSRYFSATALIIGSMSPDFEYFFLMRVKGEHSHTLAGILYFDLPVTILLSIVFHLWVKKNLILNLPIFIQKRLQDLLQLDYVDYLKKKLWIVVASAILGAGSHLFWDSFTHRNSFFARTLPFYKGTFITFEGVHYPLFYALQHISSAVGLTIIALYVVFLKPSPNREQATPRITYWVALVLLTVSVVCIRFLIYPHDNNLGNVVVSSITGFCLALICCGFINFGNTEQKSLNG